MDILCRPSFRFERSDEIQIGENYFAGSQKITRWKQQRVLKNLAIFPVNQVGGRALVLMRETRSKYSLAHYTDLGSPKHYPKLKIVRRDGTGTITTHDG
jgi:hypothetical protein